MGMKTVVSMNAQGRLTVPAEARKALHVEGETPFEMEVTEHELILRPALVIPREDAWAYTPEHLAQIEESDADARAGRIVRMTEHELEQFIADRTNG
jgi:bifunctional DNA-binding transcriptional regulator/antitoxin component of YhaV-PrlF toxin-antitoxin module